MTDVWLGLETTTSTGGVALIRGGDVLGEELLPDKVQFSRKLLPSITRLLGNTGINRDEISGIAVSAGPGSYTGVRIGLATASGLASGLGIPLKCVETLRILSFSTGLDTPVLACIRARQGEVFACLYSDGSISASHLIPPGVYTSGYIREELEACGSVTGIGDGREELGSLEAITWVRKEMDSPRPSITAFLGRELTLEHGGDDGVRPVYLRGFKEKAMGSAR